MNSGFIETLIMEFGYPMISIAIPLLVGLALIAILVDVIKKGRRNGSK
jgi:hypothetical protein